MTSAALADLQTRILSNTLTGPQQAILALALGEIDPDFPSPDETGGTNAPPDETLARTWMSALYQIQALFSGGGGVLPTQETNWYINPATGSDTNTGTSPSSPLKTVAALAALWKGTAGGGRPILAPASGDSVTVTLQDDLASGDPLAPILDVDIAAGAALMIVGGLHAAAHAGTLASASAFARTSGGGQIAITDGAVADYAPFVDDAAYFHDTTTGAIGWVYAPLTGSSATGTVSIGYSAQSAGDITPPTQTAIATGNAYTLARPIRATLGSGWTTRGFPTVTSGVSGAAASVYLFQLELAQPNVNDVTILASASAAFVLQECMVDEAIQLVEGSLIAVNCYFHKNLGITVGAAGVLECYGGGVVTDGNVTIAGGSGVLDQDFAVNGGAPITVAQAGQLILGEVGFWNDGGNNALNVIFGQCACEPIFSASAVFYGTDGGVPIAMPGLGSGPAAVLYFNDGGGTPAQDNFKFTHSVFTVGDLTSAFGFNSGTGAFVGPTTCTFAHLDTALGAGTGFGGHAIDPSTGCVMRLAA